MADNSNPSSVVDDDLLPSIIDVGAGLGSELLNNAEDQIEEKLRKVLGKDPKPDVLQKATKLPKRVAVFFAKKAANGYNKLKQFLIENLANDQIFQEVLGKGQGRELIVVPILVGTKTLGKLSKNEKIYIRAKQIVYWGSVTVVGVANIYKHGRKLIVTGRFELSNQEQIILVYTLVMLSVGSIGYFVGDTLGYYKTGQVLINLGFAMFRITFILMNRLAAFHESLIFDRELPISLPWGLKFVPVPPKTELP